jgi:hypothetical protein
MTQIMPIDCTLDLPQCVSHAGSTKPTSIGREFSPLVESGPGGDSVH